MCSTAVVTGKGAFVKCGGFRYYMKKRKRLSSKPVRGVGFRRLPRKGPHLVLSGTLAEIVCGHLREHIFDGCSEVLPHFVLGKAKHCSDFPHNGVTASGFCVTSIVCQNWGIKKVMQE